MIYLLLPALGPVCMGACMPGPGIVSSLAGIACYRLTIVRSPMAIQRCQLRFSLRPGDAKRPGVVGTAVWHCSRHIDDWNRYFIIPNGMT